MTEEAERLRSVVLWLCSKQHPATLPCADCGHDIEQHVGHPPEDGSTCLFPAMSGAPAALCRCRSFRAPSLED